jgi:hypothetical protein
MNPQRTCGKIPTRRGAAKEDPYGEKESSLKEEAVAGTFSLAECYQHVRRERGSKDVTVECA